MTGDKKTVVCKKGNLQALVRNHGEPRGLRVICALRAALVEKSMNDEMKGKVGTDEHSLCFLCLPSHTYPPEHVHVPKYLLILS